MFSGKNKKNSFLTFALALTVMIAMSLFAVSVMPAHAQEFDPHSGLIRVTNGEVAYATIESSNVSEKQQLLADLQDIADKANAYADAIDPAAYTEGATVEQELEALALYNAVMDAVDAYNAAVAGYGDDYKVSIPAEFTYRDASAPQIPVSAQTDITDRVAAKAKAELNSLASGWGNASESDYVLKAIISSVQQDEALFEVFFAQHGAPLIDPISSSCAVVETYTQKGLALEMRFTYDETDYTIAVSVNNSEKEYDSNLTAKELYTVSVIKIKDADGNEIYNKTTQTGTANFTVAIDESYVSYAETIDDILRKANSYFEGKIASTPMNRTTLAPEYLGYSERITTKISAVKTVVTDKLEIQVDSLDERLYSEDALDQLGTKLTAWRTALKNSATYNELTSNYDQAVAEISAILSLPEEFKKDNAGLITEKIYERDSTDYCEYALAIAALDKIDSYSAAVKAELESERAQIVENLKNTAIAAIDGMIAEVNVNNYADNQIREIAAKRQEAVAKIEAADDDHTRIASALTTFEFFFNQALASYQTKDSVEKGNVKVEVEAGGKLDSRTELTTADTAVVTEDTDVSAIDNSKNTNTSTRRLDAVEVFDITLSVAGKDIVSAGNTEYKVTVKMNEATVALFKEGKIDASSLVVAYVDDQGRVEPYEITLVFTYTDGTTVTYGEDVSVEWDKIAEGSIMFVTRHFSSYYLMGNTSNLALPKLSGLLEAINTDILIYAAIGVGALVLLALLALLVIFIVSLCIRYKIRFCTNGGKKVKKIRRKYGKTLPELPVPVKDGYVFTGWCIDKTLKYEFNRNVMPRANVKLYARWISEEEFKNQQEEERKTRLIGFYDKLRSKLASYKKPVKKGEKSFVAQEILAKLYAEEDHVKILIKSKLAYIKDENGMAYLIPESDKFVEGTVFDDMSYNIAVEAIEKMAAVHGLVESTAIEFEPSTYEDAVLGYAYIINYESVADFDERYCALRAYALSYAIAEPEKAVAGKVVFELLPEGKESLDLTLSLDMDRYHNILKQKKTVGDLENTYTIYSGEDMGAAFELIDRVMKENGFAVADVETENEFNLNEAYQYIIYIEEEEPAEEVVEEVDLAAMFKEYRSYVSSFALFADEGADVDRSNDGKLLIKARLTDEQIETTLDPECDAEAFCFADAAGFTTAKEKVDAVMIKYGFEPSDKAEVEEIELGSDEMFGYRIHYKPEMTADELFEELRSYTNSFAMFVDEGVEPDTSLDGIVIVKAHVKKDSVILTVDPDAEAQEIIVTKEADLAAAKEAILAAMTKYGMEVDPDYVPATEKLEGESFGFRCKF